MRKIGRVEKLTARAVETASPEPARYIVWDAELAGFGLRVEPSGRKSFIARYRAGGGRSGTLRQITLGRLGALTAAEGRRKAKTILGAAAFGGDPLGEMRSRRAKGITVGELCDWYLAEASAGRLLGRHNRPIKASTLATDRNRVEAHVRRLLGRRPVEALTVRDFEQMQADIAAGKTAERPEAGNQDRGGFPTGGSGTAGRTLGMLSTICEHAVRHGLIEANPARGARKFASQRRTRRLSADEIRSFGFAMRAGEAEGENSTGLAAIKLILTSGFRRSEALSLRSEWILPTGGVDFPDTKSGPQVRPVGRAAIELLNRQTAHVGQVGWVFPADRGTGHFVGLPKVLARVSERAGLQGVTAHVLRHTFASMAGELGFSELTIAGLLGHSAGSVTSRYVHLDTALVTAADRVSTVVADALDGKPGAEVFSLAGWSERS